MPVGPRCWARNFSPCCGKQSREHYISKALFSAPVVEVFGFEWLRGERRRVGMSALVAKCLCKRHNEMLSELDEEAKRLFDAIKSIARDHYEPRSAEHSLSGSLSFEVDGRRMERWFVKSLINLVVLESNRLRWPAPSRDGLDPAPWLVEHAFGHGDLEAPAGLHIAIGIGKRWQVGEQIAFAPLLKGQNEVVGGAFDFKGQKFVLSLFDRHLGAPEPYIDSIGPDWRGLQLQRRIESLRFLVDQRLKYELRFRWAEPSSPPAG